MARGQPRQRRPVRPESTVTRPSEVASTISWRPSPLRSASAGEASPELPRLQRVAALEQRGRRMDGEERAVLAAVAVRVRRAQAQRPAAGLEPARVDRGEPLRAPARGAARGEGAPARPAPRPGRARAPSGWPSPAHEAAHGEAGRGWRAGRASGAVMSASGGNLPGLHARHRRERVHAPPAREAGPSPARALRGLGQVVGGADHDLAHLAGRSLRPSALPRASTSAATPATCGVAAEVPLQLCV